ncbi:hypothetical protein EVAR_46923_1 [Eumeta japonica]|uniref:Uncharacterized protein n=1 Tax=Eumeta variegata TaxID=151549 RepID=A0A4C1XZL3_EUMVA|nr:hypothetical protein EVAR_46923_1 [Eumeta japonica]
MRASGILLLLDDMKKKTDAVGENLAALQEIGTFFLYACACVPVRIKFQSILRLDIFTALVTTAGPQLLASVELPSSQLLNLK